ncbi:MAG: hypothetical protein ISS50_02205 [Anaerolineae bacterium]|nr:hypothetical protein [Anaerolineae bacterium]
MVCSSQVFECVVRRYLILLEFYVTANVASSTPASPWMVACLNGKPSIV